MGDILLFGLCVFFIYIITMLACCALVFFIPTKERGKLTASFSSCTDRHTVPTVTRKGILSLYKTLTLQTAKKVIPKSSYLQSSPWSQQAVLPSNKLHIPFNIWAETSACSLDSERYCSYSKWISGCFILVLKLKNATVLYVLQKF